MGHEVFKGHAVGPVLMQALKEDWFRGHAKRMVLSKQERTHLLKLGVPSEPGVGLEFALPSLGPGAVKGGFGKDVTKNPRSSWLIFEHVHVGQALEHLRQ